MDDKMFELMTKIYGELTDFRKETDKRLDSLENQVSRLENQVTCLGNQVTCLENKVDNNSKTLFDGYKQTYEKVVDVENEVKNLSSKLEKQEVEIKVIKGGR